MVIFWYHWPGNPGLLLKRLNEWLLGHLFNRFNIMRMLLLVYFRVYTEDHWWLCPLLISFLGEVDLLYLPLFTGLFCCRNHSPQQRNMCWWSVSWSNISTPFLTVSWTHPARRPHLHPTLTPNTPALWRNSRGITFTLFLPSSVHPFYVFFSFLLNLNFEVI